MIDYSCPKCQAALSSPPAMAGQLDECPRCRNKNIVPKTDRNSPCFPSGSDRGMWAICGIAVIVSLLLTGEFPTNVGGLLGSLLARVVLCGGIGLSVSVGWWYIFGKTKRSARIGFAVGTAIVIVLSCIGEYRARRARAPEVGNLGRQVVDDARASLNPSKTRAPSRIGELHG